MRGNKNPNYKHGKTCEPQYCECGNLKDFRAKQCASCYGHIEIEYSLDELIEVVKTSKSYSQVASRMGVSRQTAKRWIEKEGIEIPHFKAGRGRAKSPESYLILGDKRCNSTIKKVLIDNSLLAYECLWCGIGPEWNGKPLTIELDHINGNPYDNRLENLRFLCPNCHSQTETAKGRNTRK